MIGLIASERLVYRLNFDWNWNTIIYISFACVIILLRIFIENLVCKAGSNPSALEYSPPEYFSMTIRCFFDE